VNGTRKRKRQIRDAAEAAIELACRWLHKRKMTLSEIVTDKGLNAGMAISSSCGKVEFHEWDFPEWDWAGDPVPKDEAALALVEWLFGEDGDEAGDGPDRTSEEISRVVSPGRCRIEIRTAPVPKFRFSSLEEFVLKAEASGEFA